ncbi:pirin family protein [Oceanicoccus sp. KOV_DT_Chl]|uniref:pirin family protein n=1 Tax=Oceanicoccus sp. KOV_DT_Chl TaxID=1904639 RepID=UPI000C7D9600|nr:pirin family protein [Oceanicoccus sp. KOV_DT_Chl]
MRIIQQVIAARPAQDGDGVKIHRLAGKPLQVILNPFLMIDEINSEDAVDYIGGFPEHPHRGFETITYMKAGRMRHRDHMGNEGVVGAGDVQWMTAGAGVLHSEMPEQEQGLLHGFQLWLNLPAAEKMKPAAYQEISSTSIPEQQLPAGGLVRVIAGDITIGQSELKGVLSARTTQPILADVSLTANEKVELHFSADQAALVYLYQGATDVLKLRQLGVYSTGDTLALAAGLEGAELLVLSGKPLSDPVAQYGPFVMNTMEQIEQAIADFNNQQLVSES